MLDLGDFYLISDRLGEKGFTTETTCELDGGEGDCLRDELRLGDRAWMLSIGDSFEFLIDYRGD